MISRVVNVLEETRREIVISLRAVIRQVSESKESESQASYLSGDACEKKPIQVMKIIKEMFYKKIQTSEVKCRKRRSMESM